MNDAPKTDWDHAALADEKALAELRERAMNDKISELEVEAIRGKCMTIGIADLGLNGLARSVMGSFDAKDSDVLRLLFRIRTCSDASLPFVG